MTIRSRPTDDGSDLGSVATWRLESSLVFATGPATRRFTLRRTPWGWDLTLHDYEVVLDGSTRQRVPGLSIAWTVPAEFWRWIGVIEDHDVGRADVLATLRGPGDPALDALADDLAAAREGGPGPNA